MQKLLSLITISLIIVGCSSVQERKHKELNSIAVYKENAFDVFVQIKGVA